MSFNYELKWRHIISFSLLLLASACGVKPSTGLVEETREGSELDTTNPQTDLVARSSPETTENLTAPTVTPTRIQTPTTTMQDLPTPLMGISAEDIYSLDTQYTLTHHTSEFCSQADWSPDSEHIVSVGWDSKIKVWSPFTRNAPLEFESETPGIEHVGWSPAGNTIVLGSFDGNGYTWDFPSRELRGSLRPRMNRISDIDFSADGNQVAISDHMGKIYIFDVDSGDLVQRYYLSGILGIDWSPDGQYLAAGLYDNTIRIIDHLVGQQIKVLSEHSGNVNDVKWSPNGSILAAASEDGTLSLWETDQWSILKVLSHERGSVGSLGWSPNGELLASGGGNNNSMPIGDNALYLWNTAKLSEPKIFAGHEDHIITTSWSPDGNHLMTCSWDGTLRVWGLSP